MRSMQAVSCEARPRGGAPAGAALTSCTARRRLRRGRMALYLVVETPKPVAYLPRFSTSTTRPKPSSDCKVNDISSAL